MKKKKKKGPLIRIRATREHLQACTGINVLESSSFYSFFNISYFETLTMFTLGVQCTLPDPQSTTLTIVCFVFTLTEYDIQQFEIHNITPIQSVTMLHCV